MEQVIEIAAGSEGKTREAFDILLSLLSDSVQQNNQLNQHIEYLKHDIRLLKKRLFGSSSEQQPIDTPSQQDLPLFNDLEICAQYIEQNQSPAAQESIEQTKTKKPAARKRLPAHFPRKVIEHDLTDEEKQCTCGNELECIGSQKSEQLEYQPAKALVIEHHCKKYVCACCKEANKKDPSDNATLVL